ncbi:MAG TPA: glycosyltransferase family 2 protein [Thermoanaerobaculia bacterium]|jgi:GT2 family glycosyltransferase|nr:glycosyltransferase family 2 protein [Thermoanaerobaculia bacterium]
MRLAVILVHYHTPELAAAAVEALRADIAGSAGLGLDEVEWLLVDNGSDAAGRRLLESLPVERIDPGANLGYAGGVNLGLARSKAERILLMNPDVIVLPGCVAALLQCLQDGAAVAGPRFYWDHGRRLVQPPSEVRSRREELAALLAGRSPGWAARARRRWRRHARRHWEARSPLPSYALSGSLLALSRSAWEKVGPFDEGFRLYFEETDWLLRAERQGLASRYVPGAEAVHLYNQSAAREPKAQQWFEESAGRFRRRHYGLWFVKLLEGLDRRLPRSGAASPLARVPPEGLRLPEVPSAFPLWVEVSPNPVGFPAAAELLSGPPGRSWSLPAEIAGRLPADSELTLQVADGAGREIGRFALPCGAVPAARRGAA